MKSFIKYVKGGLKMALVSWPVILTLGGLAGFSGLLADGFIKEDKIYDEIRNTPLVQELIEQEKAKNDVATEESGLSPQEWNSRNKYLESDAFIKDTIDHYPELKEYKDKEYISLVEKICSPVFILPISFGIISCYCFYTKLSENPNVPAFYKMLMEIAKKDLCEAQETKNSKKFNKELNKYKEEVL